MLRAGLIIFLLPGLQGSHCRDRAGWFTCNTSSLSCLSPAQVCDGQTDCENGSDEEGELCRGRQCEDGVRCEDGGACIRVPGQVLCRGEERRACQDRSDQAYCLHSSYTGCLLSTEEGLTISHCDRCLCQLRGETVYTSGKLRAPVCLGLGSTRLCDGVVDCDGGQDEGESLCLLSDQKEDLQWPASVQIMTLVFLTIFLICLSFCCLIILIMFKLCTKRHNSDDNKEDLPPLRSSNVSNNVYVMEGWRERPKWSLTTTKIIKELGTGYFSKVFMSEDKYHGYVAIKTAQPSNSGMAQRSIINEINVLKELGKHSNIIHMVDSNVEERLMVLEFCLYGNCKEYIARNKNLFVNQIDPETKEMKIDEKGDFLFINNDLLDTKTLIRWSVDISRGLTYLNKMHIIHRDLALRNILLSGQKTAKISDFGLAVAGGERQALDGAERALPYKHSALESLVSCEFSSKSDVWALGVTLWEIFSLASEPHQEISSPEDLVTKLETGQRLTSCHLAPLSLQSLMEDCWAEAPTLRPAARDITNTLTPLLYQQVPTPVVLRNDPPQYSSPRSTPLVTSRSFYWTNYKVLQGQPVPCSDTDGIDKSS